VDNLSVLTGADYLAKANAPSPLTQRTTPFISNSVRGLVNVRASFGIGTGGYALTLRFDPRGGDEEKLGGFLAIEALPKLVAIPEITGAHLLVADKTASSQVPVERKGRPTIIPNWIVVVEGITLEALERACDVHLALQSLKEHGCGDVIERETYSLQIMVAKPPAGRG
jgi:hypothetical protein